MTVLPQFSLLIFYSEDVYLARKNIYKYPYSTEDVHTLKSDLHVYMIMLEIEGDSELELLNCHLQF